MLLLNTLVAAEHLTVEEQSMLAELQRRRQVTVQAPHCTAAIRAAEHRIALQRVHASNAICLCLCVLECFRRWTQS